MKGVTNIATKEISLGIQIERRIRDDMYNSNYSGFTETEEIAFNSFIDFLSTKVAELNQLFESNRKTELLLDTSAVLSLLIDRRTVADFIIGVREHIGKYFGYEYSGFLYYSKQGTFFIHIDQTLRTYFTNNFMGNNQDMMKFPCDSGMSGTAFKEERVIFLNGKKLETNLSDLDNTGSYCTIHSFAFIPTYGINNKKNGILQLYNKKIGSITKNDLKEYSIMQSILGRILDNVMELNEALDFMLLAKLTMAKIINNTTFHGAGDIVIYLQ